MEPLPRTWAEAEKEVSYFFNDIVREMHPCKDAVGNPLWNYKTAFYELHVDNVPMPGGARPLTVDLLSLLEKTFVDEHGEEIEEPDTTELRLLLMAILENGQRHDGVLGHGYDKPCLGVHPCARHDIKKKETYCRYLFPSPNPSVRA